MGTNQIQVNLKFNADVQQAKQSMLDLQNSLRSLTTTDLSKSMGSMGLTQEIQEATVKVTQLRTQLEAATNVNTGKLNLKTFNTQLKTSGNTLEQYKASLMALGPAGQQAFAQLARSVATAETPFISLSARMEKTFTTLANTARWQLASSVINGLSGAMQRAYGYAQDLNKSLTDIRIVSGYGVDEMAKFAESANKAAKALSSTTTAYTNAALIYYQQGLSNAEVEERTATTIKMANVTGENAEAVSSYMTAIWNNFDDGSKSLEYYADVITALGAATAASSEEIAGGLEKFAAIGETIGLSYEYATAALTTIVAETRQSEDVVGTALKTIFARIQGLKLGESLEDGTDLNKYSAALATVGINIKDASGNLKDMDVILDELGGKWDSLTKAEQMALAQTVAGVRQYTQFIALMDNYQDVFQENLNTAYDAEGSLEEQQKVYAESWKAASKRAQAAMENIYQSLLNDEFFIKLTNMFAEMGEGLGEFLDNIGGAKTVLLLLGSIITQIFNQQIVAGITNVGNSIFYMTKKGKASLNELRHSANQALQQMANDGSIGGKIMTEAYKELGSIYDTFNEKIKGMTEEQKKQANMLLQQKETRIAETEELVKQLQLEEKKLKTSSGRNRRAINRYLSSEEAQTTGQITKSQATIVAQNLQGLNNEKLAVNTQNEVAKAGIAMKIDSTFIESIKQMNNELETAQGKYNALNEVSTNVLEKISGTHIKTNSKVSTTKETLNSVVAEMQKYKGQSDIFGKDGAAAFDMVEKAAKQLMQTIETADPAAQLQDVADTDLNNLRTGLEAVKEIIKNLGGDVSVLEGRLEKLNSVKTGTAEGRIQENLRDNKGKGLAIAKDDQGNVTATSDQIFDAGIKADPKVVRETMNEMRKGATETAAQMGRLKTLRDEALGGDLWLETADGIEQNNNMINQLQNQLSNLKIEAQRTGQTFKEKFGEEGKQALKELSEALKSGDIDAINQSLMKVDSTIEAMNINIDDTRKKLKNLTNGSVDIENTLDQAEETGSTEMKADLNLNTNIQENEKFKKQLIDLKLKTNSFAEGLTKVSSSLMTISMGIQAIQSLGNIWKDEDLSFGEKILQTMMSLSMLLPVITTALKSKTAATLIDSLVEKKALAIKSAKIAETKVETVAEEKLTKAKWKKIAAQIAANWYYAAAVVAIVALVGVIALLINAYDTEAKAYEEAKERTQELKTSYQEANQAAKELKETISDYSEAIDAINKLEKGTLEYKQAIIDANEKALELLDTYEGLSKYAYRDKNGAIVISQEGLDSILQQQMELAQLKQTYYIDAQIEENRLKEKIDLKNFSQEYNVEVDNWEEISKNIVKIIADYMEKNNLTELIDDDLDEILSLEGVSTASEQVQESIKSNIRAYGTMANQLNETERAQKLLAETCIEEAYKMQNPDAGTNPENERVERAELAIFSTQQTHYKLSEEQQNAAVKRYKDEKFAEFYGEDGVNTFSEALLYQPVVGPDGSYVPGFDPSRSATGDDAAYYADLVGYDMGNWYKGKDGKYTSYSNGNYYAWPTHYEGGFLGIGATQYYDFTKNGETVSLTGDQLMQKIADEEQKIIDNIYAEMKAPDLLASIDTVLDAINIGKNEEALDGLFLSAASGKIDVEGSVMSQAQAKDILANWDTVTEAFSGYDETTGFWTNQGFADAEAYLSALNDWLTTRASQSDASVIDSKFIEEVNSGLKNSISEMISGDLTSENADLNEGYNAITTQLKQLQTIFPELSEEVEIFTNKGLIGTELWTQSAYILQDKLNELKLDQLIEAADDAEKAIKDLVSNSVDIEATLQSDEFETALDNLLEKNYAIDIEIHAQAENAFDTFISSAEQMKTMASKIGENYIVAASDIRELNNVFPGIIQGMQDVGDGSVRLNQQVVQNAMNSANAEVQASAYSTIEQLENQATILRSKQATYMAMYQAALALAKGEGDAEENTATIKEGLNTIEALNNQELSTTKQENAEAVATDSNVQAGIVAQNWNSAYQSAAESAIEFAKTAVSAAQAAQTGEAVYSMGDFGVTYSGRNGQSSEAAKLAEIESAVNAASSAEDYAELAQSFLEAANAAGMQANDIEGMIAEIGATGIDLNHLMGDIGSGKGSGNGGGGSKKRTQEKKTSKDEVERYHVINKQLESMGKKLDDISKKKDRAFGPEKLKYMDQEIAAMQEQIKLQEQYKKEVEANLVKDKAAIEKYGAVFDADGNITNYEQIVENQLKEYNKAVDTFNKSAQEEADDEALKKAEEKYDEFKEILEQYEETNELNVDVQADLTEFYNQLDDLELEKITYEIEYKIEIDDSQLEYLEFLLNRVNDEAFEAANAIGYLGDQTELTFNKLNTLLSGIDEIMAREGVSETDYTKFMQGDDSVLEKYAGITENEREQIKEWRSEMISLNEELFDIQETVQGKVLETFQAWTDEIETQIELFDKYTSTLEHYRNIIDIVGKDTLGISSKTLNELRDAQRDVLHDRMRATQAELEAVTASRERVEQAIASARARGDETSAKSFENDLKEIQAKENELLLDLQAQLEESLQLSKDKFIEATDEMIQDFKDSIAELFGEFEFMKTQYDHFTEKRENYLADYKKMYELNKLNNDLQKSIDETDNIKAKQMLSKLQDEINGKMADGSKMTQYELDYLTKKLEVKKAEIALEEAQDAKSQVRLVRQSTGEYGYMYTADQAKIDEAKQNLETKIFELTELTQNYIKEQENQAIELVENMVSEFETIRQMHADNLIDDEKFNDMMEQTRSHYMDQLKLTQVNMEQALTNAKDFYNNDAEAYEELIGYKFANDDSYLDHFNETFLSQLGDGYDSWGEMYRDIADESAEMLDEMAEASAELQEDFEEDMQEAGHSMDTFADEIEEGMETVQTEAERTADTVEDMSSSMKSSFDDTVGAVEDWQRAYSEAINTVITDIRSLVQAQNELNNIKPPKKEEKKEEKPKETTTTDKGSSGSDKKIITDDQVKGVAAAIWYDGHASGWGNWPIRKETLESKFGKGSYEKLQDYINSCIAKDGGQTMYDYGVKLGKSGRKKYYYSSFDTGGYTGSWGNEGRLAMLHQKELVLNAKDTENMLSAVSIVRDILKEIDLRAVSAIVGAASLTPGITPAMAQTLEQDVTIHAEFPNVQDRNEIEEAFKTLVNEASQYANRKR